MPMIAKLELYQYRCNKTRTKSKLVKKSNSIASLSEMVILWCLFYLSLHDFHLIISPNNNSLGSKQEGVPAKVKGLEQLKHLSTKMQDKALLQLLWKMKSSMADYSYVTRCKIRSLPVAEVDSLFVTLWKRNSTAGAFLWIFANFKNTYSVENEGTAASEIISKYQQTFYSFSLWFDLSLIEMLLNCLIKFN